MAALKWSGTISILLSLITIAYCGCKKNDRTSPASSKNSLTTIWAPQQYDVNDYYDGEDHRQIITAEEKDYLSLKEDGTCNGQLYPLGKFSGKWALVENKTLKIENATVEKRDLLDDPNNFSLDISNATDKSMQVHLKINKRMVLKSPGNTSSSLDYTEIGTTLFNLYHESLGKGKISFADQSYVMYKTVVGNKDMFGNKGFFMYGYGRDNNGRDMQMFIRHSYDEIYADQTLVFGSRGLTLLHVQWIDAYGQVMESTTRTFGADGEQVRVTSDGVHPFVLSFEGLTEMDKWNEKPIDNGIKASGFMRGKPE